MYIEKNNRFSKIYYSSEDPKFLVLADNPNTTEPFKKGFKFLSGGGGLVSTLEDFFNFASIFLDKGRFKETQLLKSETIDLITKNYLKDSSDWFEESKKNFCAKKRYDKKKVQVTAYPSMAILNLMCEFNDKEDTLDPNSPGRIIKNLSRIGGGTT